MDDFSEHDNKITLPIRRDIIDYLLFRPIHYTGKLDYVSFLRRIWDLSKMPSTDRRFSTAEGDIRQHMDMNSDWDEQYLLGSRLNLFGCEDKIFLQFLEQSVHPIVLTNRDELQHRIGVFNDLLAPVGFRFEVVKLIGDEPVYQALTTIPQTTSNSETVYEVLFSYASEDRVYVEAVATFLKAKRVKVFYDRFEEITLWGKDLQEYFDKIFRGDSRYCVMFISESYAYKMWPNHERQSALAKALEKTEYVLPARFDCTEVPGLRPTIGYVDLKTKSPEQLGEMILQKLGRIG